ncbi:MULTISPECIES: nuclear transport factor 2 family protein [Streptomyces]|uniref:nuclear transport factor 2 family protein n=1 Tax=Streptomyces TaxID=1883 RepID=UPI0013E0BDF7|nr:nuclear transport factor 2 family protein [Streptomyces sp. RLB3-6]
MSATENKKLALAFFEHLMAGGLDAALALVDEKAVWRVSGQPDIIPLAGTYKKSDIVGLATLVGKVMPGVRLTVTTTTAEDDRVLLECMSQGVSPAGKTYDNRVCFSLEVRDGLIQSIREYYDTIHANDVMFQRTYSTEHLAEK